MIFDPFFKQLQATSLNKHAALFEAHIRSGFSLQRNKNLDSWLNALSSLPTIHNVELELSSSVTLTTTSALTGEQQAYIETQLRQLIPWRKGPFQLFNIHIDTEWRSDWKWDRLKPHIRSLKDKNVLDVGCGSGYHCWRMLGEGAKWVLGIDPSARFVVQFEMIKHFAGKNLPIHVVPLAMEHMPSQLNFFDTVFSMGVLYHRRSPIDHINELKQALAPGGELVLETLIIDGKLGDVLVPEGRYGMMPNVWFLPSIPTLESWLRKCGFENPRCVDVADTTVDEQRTTEWMPSYSLSNFLDPKDPSKTAEGHPAPRRAVFIASKKA